MQNIVIRNDYVEVELQCVSHQWQGNAPTKAQPNTSLWLELDRTNFTKLDTAFKDTFNGQRLDGCHSDGQVGYEFLGVFYDNVGYTTVQEVLEDDDKIEARYIVKVI